MCAGKGTVQGTIFKTDSSGNNYTDVYTFSNAIDGVEPYGSLVQAADGNLYGMTSGGGRYGHGVLFMINPQTGVYTKQHDFDSLGGRQPYGSLCRASNGKLYGMTNRGGSLAQVKDRGVLFEYDPATKTFVKKVDFNMQNGGYPYGSLIQGSDGDLYAMTSRGGVDGTGLFFKYNSSTVSITGLASFVAGSGGLGYEPIGDVMQAADGNFYCMSQYGAAWGTGGGVLFKYDPSATFSKRITVLHKFADTMPGAVNGNGIAGSLIQAANGNLYGMTIKGGTDNAGTIFEYDIVTDTLKKLYDFDSTAEGYGPLGSLMQASNGLLYGLLTSENGQARMFSFDIATNTLTVKANVTGTPHYTTLIETMPAPNSISNQHIADAVKIYPVPATNTFTVELHGSTNAELVITNSTGQVVYKADISGNKMNINTSTWARGIYTCTISTGNDVVNRNVIIE